MSETINELYQKYTETVGMTLEDDRYFQYLYEMVNASKNILSHQHQVLHKVVDERWLSTIEECLDSINNIIEKPRRFITTKEEVVPVALAKKITADSVRHLSMNTQFIASDENGEIQPTRILNVSTEESYDLYENRFIYHLIQRLVTFIDKRTDVIFWSTGDETSDTMTMESKVDDAYEQISYKIEMTVKNNQNFVENDSDNMSVFMRIDHVRRLVMALRQSSFCNLMAGCAKVHSPIQRTNLLMKDPDYKKCYKLWQFLESYDEVGYYIDVQNTPLEYDEEYMIQMYTNLIANYTVFKSLIDPDSRHMSEITPTKHRSVKPKFVKKIQEVQVYDRDIPEVEVRQVFIEEVTEAQLAAEAKVVELTEQLEAANKELDDTLERLSSATMQVGQLMQQNMEFQAELADEREARENAEGELAQLTEDAEAALAEAEANLNAKEEEMAQAAAEAEEKLSKKDAELAEASDKILALQNEKAEVEKQKAAAEAAFVAKEAEIAALAVAKDSAYAEMVSSKDSAYAEMVSSKDSAYEEMVAKKDVAFADMSAAKDAEKEEAVSKKQAEYDEMVSKNQTEIEELTRNKDAAFAEMVSSKDAAFADMSAAKDAEKAEVISKKQSEFDEMVTKKQAEYDEMVSKNQTEIEELTRNKDAAFAEMSDAKDKAYAEMVTSKEEAFARMVEAKNAEKDEALTKKQSEFDEMASKKQTEFDEMVVLKDEAFAGMVSYKDEAYSDMVHSKDKAYEEMVAAKDEVYAAKVSELENALAEAKKHAEAAEKARLKLEEKYKKLKQKRSIVNLIRKKPVNEANEDNESNEE